MPHTPNRLGTSAVTKTQVGEWGQRYFCPLMFTNPLYECGRILRKHACMRSRRERLLFVLSRNSASSVQVCRDSPPTKSRRRERQTVKVFRRRPPPHNSCGCIVLVDSAGGRVQRPGRVQRLWPESPCSIDYCLPLLTKKRAMNRATKSLFSLYPARRSVWCSIFGFVSKQKQGRFHRRPWRHFS